MNIAPSTSDLEFRDRIEAGGIQPSDFSHREHLRLAFVYLCESDMDGALERMRSTLMRFLRANNAPAGKYHETLTLSWLQAVRHFMDLSHGAISFDAFLAADDRFLDTKIMLTHYRRETLFSEKARWSFIAPDLQPILCAG